MIEVTFYGVRGSIPCSCPSTQGVGGNTSSVLLRVDDENPILLDLGTGLRYLGKDLMVVANGKPFEGTALVSHLHWDHIQGLPFFVPILQPGASMNLIGPVQDEGELAEAIASFVCPPLFPVTLDELPGEITMTARADGAFSVGSATVTVASVPHVGPTNGYRIETDDASVAYIPDHQQPGIGATEVADSVLELCEGVDLLIHDAQYDSEEFPLKSTWGHSTIDYAAEIARQAGAKRLVLFHHDPSHDDEWVAEAARLVEASTPDSLQVLAAAERMRLVSGRI